MENITVAQIPRKPKDIPARILSNPLLHFQNVTWKSHFFPNKDDHNRTAQDIFHYPSTISDINKDTQLPFPTGFTYLDMNVIVP